MKSSNGVHEKNGKTPAAVDTDSRMSQMFPKKERPALSTCDGVEPREGILYVEKGTPGDYRDFVIYSPALRGFWTHYTSKGTVPCYADHSLCPGGHKDSTLRQNFLLHAWDVKKQKQVFAYLTPGAAQSLLLQVGKGVSMRGLMIRVSKTPGKNGRMHVKLVETQCVDKRHIPPELDAYATIMNFLKVEDVDRPHKRSLASPNDAADLDLNG
jgi:hypothetical protein